jgi:GNAT superfamily N-acetyltransferase
MPTSRSRPAQAYDLLRTRGVRAGGRALLQKVGKRIYRCQQYIVIAKRLDGHSLTEATQCGAERIDVREGSQAEVLEFTSIITDGDRKAERRVREYLTRNYRCALGFRNGVPFGQLWWSDSRSCLEPTQDLDPQIRFFEVELDERDAWCFKFEVLPSHRGHGRATILVKEIESMLYHRGYQRMLGYVDADNLPARWIWEISGFRPVRSVTSRYWFSRIGISHGRLLLKVRERRRFVTFPYRPVLGGQARRRILR